ncbi:ThiF family adenylyltransferase [Rhizobium laguerreae]|uniref:ThiF family adenylyltransferase n=1 Tax=Rhizobium laguerreae TaxID=1076926 RepID=UPI001C90C8BF|nr:ThiF family adenylyltransferase [Rhizobium laguerreae]MBY3087981.1 ThiF family adenylyltransferase [Rhizobium laguerreae]MBY3148820.1 ThiF family adenylyltransferase [Rhizobium laguerreae]
MLFQLASHNPDIQKLIDRGFALRFDSNFLVVRDIPYLEARGNLCWGAIVTVLKDIDGSRVEPVDHQIFFAGGVPYGLDGNPIPSLGGGAAEVTLAKTDVVVQRSFSNKPPGGLPDFYTKIEHYLSIVSGPARHRYPEADPFTFNVDDDAGPDSVFHFRDTLTSRALIGDLAGKFACEVVALIGLGGTGGYVLDYLTKTNILEIRGYDPKPFHVHNAFRSPGQLSADELGRPKAEVYQNRYQTFRKGLHLEAKAIDRNCEADFAGVTFAFVCVDSGTARAEIFDLLIRLGIPFIDVGMGLVRQNGALAGMIRTTVLKPENAEEVRAKQLVPLSDPPGHEYRANIQIAELNAMNASIAVLAYKQHCGFYAQALPPYNILMNTTLPHLFVEPDA